ncbi:MAG: hypothetical protein J6T95_02440 [Oscillospiraceae bacterium]|nr:hypothetical protein [Oscillospiraceae bacterium]
MFKFWGDGSAEARQAVENITVRSTENFNWTFIFILAVVFYVYWTEVKNKNFKAIFAGFALGNILAHQAHINIRADQTGNIFKYLPDLAHITG